MFLFLKSEFGVGKKATGRYLDFHAVFCGQFSISLHSSVQNWSSLLWLLYCLAVEMLDGQSQIMSCFWLLSDFAFFFLLEMSPGMKANKLWFSLPALRGNTQMCSPWRASQLVWSWGEGRWRGRDWHVVKARHCHLAFDKGAWTSLLTLGTEWFPSWFACQNGRIGLGVRRKPSWRLPSSHC